MIIVIDEMHNMIGWLYKMFYTDNGKKLNLKNKIKDDITTSIKIKYKLKIKIFTTRNLKWEVTMFIF